jgi:hypothetical protein
MLGLFVPKRLLTPFSIVRHIRQDGLAFGCVYVFGIRIMYFTVK